MKDKKDCKIIQDLLPNYIEKLTTAQTNNYIENHLDECNECSKIFENMKKEIKIDTEKIDKREVKYIKKYSNKMRILKSIIFIILILFVSLTVRKIAIVINLQNKAEEYIVSTDNFHRVVYTYDKDHYQKTEYFKLGDKQKVIQTKLTENGKSIWQAVGKEKIINKYGAEVHIVNIYKEYNGYKEALENKELSMSADPHTPFHTENWWQLFICSMQASIKTSTYNGEECYYVSNFGSVGYASDGVYISKKTGLPVSMIAYEYENEDGTRRRVPAIDYFYEFNTVTEEDFIEPNINEYKIISK